MKETIVDLVQRLTPDDYEYTVQVGGIRYDIYSFVAQNGKVGSVALSIQKGTAVVSVIRVGILTEEEMEREIERACYGNGLRPWRVH